MLKSILAVSQGGPDSAMSFKLAKRLVSVFGDEADMFQNHLSSECLHECFMYRVSPAELR